jgi:uncharacterized protein (TIGR00255 family)
MSVYSMTGFGIASIAALAPSENEAQTKTDVTIEVRSVNGRFLDVIVKAPDDARALEPSLRELVASRIKRGKVELRVASSRESDAALPSPLPEQLMHLARLEGTVKAYFDKAAPLSVHEVMAWCRQAAPKPRADQAMLDAARDAVEALVQSRRREGERLVDALRANARQVRELAARAQPLVESVVQRQQQRFVERWNEALKLTGAADTVSPQASQERALAEAAGYALRIDVAEELIRLSAHLDELESLLSKGGELGKRLDFLVQEMHREANTLGAKSQALELTNLSMAMKVAIEQMREQVQNIE